MSLIKSSKFWSTLALLASLLIILAMGAIMFGYRGENFTFREASTHLRTAAQASAFVAGFSALVALLSWKSKASMIKALFATAIVLTPLMILKNNMPAGTQLFAAAPAGPPPGAGGAMGAGAAMGAGGAMGPGGAMGGGDPSTAPTNDISTDMQNPPIFSAVIPLRPEGSNPIEYAGQSAAAAQAAQFPDIKPINTPLSKAEAFGRALEVANSMGFEIIAQDANSGIIEAVSSTRFFNFQDDVVIRVTENGANSIVDIRSHSRVGRGDRGKNAERVRDFISSF